MRPKEEALEKARKERIKRFNAISGYKGFLKRDKQATEDINAVQRSKHKRIHRISPTLSKVYEKYGA